MLRFIGSKILKMVAVLVGVTAFTYTLIHLIPGSPWNNYASSQRALQNTNADLATMRELNRRFGLDLPLWRQYTRFMIGDIDDSGTFFCGALCGNLGPSIKHSGRSVQSVLFEPPEGKPAWDSRFGYSLRLALLGVCITIGIGLPLGILSAAWPRSRLSRWISVFLAALVSIPNFVLGLLAIVVLASWLKVMNVLPDWREPAHWVIPAVVLAVMPLASTARVTHAALIDILNEDYVRAARAKGLSQARVILKHVTRTALAPIITFTGPALVEMFTGLFVIENLYAFPGIGREFWLAILSLDYTLIMGLTLVYATGIILINTMIELTCAALDPRIRSAQSPGNQ